MFVVHPRDKEPLLALFASMGVRILDSVKEDKNIKLANFALQAWWERKRELTNA